MLRKRVLGQASFASQQDSSGSIQIYIKCEEIGAEASEAFKH